MKFFSIDVSICLLCSLASAHLHAGGSERNKIKVNPLDRIEGINSKPPVVKNYGRKINKQPKATIFFALAHFEPNAWQKKIVEELLESPKKEDLSYDRSLFAIREEEAINKQMGDLKKLEEMLSLFNRKYRLYPFHGLNMDGDFSRLTMEKVMEGIRNGFWHFPPHMPMSEEEEEKSEVRERRGGHRRKAPIWGPLSKYDIGIVMDHGVFNVYLQPLAL